jgi:Penicillin amidase
MTSREALNAYGAITWGQFFIYQGFNERAGWMHTTSGVDDVDEYLEDVQQRGDQFVYRYGRRHATRDRDAGGHRVPQPVRDVYFYPDELRGHIEREYHPGE